MYFQFLFNPVDPSLIIFGDYEPWLVILSVFVAIFSASVALETAKLVLKTENKVFKTLLLLVGSFSMGGGIWAMHFIGMIAFKICGNSGYDVTITLISMIPSVLASLVALKLISYEKINLKHMIVGGLLIGLGIGSMHYTGMAAMLISSQLYYDPFVFMLSILFAVSLSILGVWIRFGLVQHFPSLTSVQVIVASGTVLGLATSGMHYTGMAAAVFVGDPEVCETVWGINQSDFLALGVASVTVLIAFLALGLNLFIKQKNFNSYISRARLRQTAIINTAVDGMILIDASGLIIEFNPACESMFGYKRDEVLGKNVKRLMPQQYSAHHDEYLKKYNDTGEKKIIGVGGRELSGQRKNGETFPLELSVGETDSNNEKLYIGILREITERKAMEEQLMNAISEAEQAAQAKTIFLANMSHEIRTPMNAIIGFVEIVLAQSLNEEQRRHLTTVHHSARALLRLLNDILDSAKLDQNSVELEIRPFDLLDFLDEIYSVFSIRAQDKKIDWKIEYEPEIQRCFLGDIVRIRQIIVNLVGNAIKFTSEGQVRLSIKQQADNLLFCISDTGIGIAADKLDDIFKPFSQSDVSMTRRFGGTGLGTSISMQLVELMGGRIWVESELHKGSQFFFTLPLAASECPELPVYEASYVVANTAPLNILLAEDVDANATLASIRLEQQGHQITWVENGQDAVETYKKQNFDLVLMDIQMPVMDGLSATNVIRDYEKQSDTAHDRKHVPIIALTAGAFEEDRNAAQKAGMDGFVTKPIDFVKLFNEIDRVTGCVQDKALSQSNEDFLVEIGALNSIDTEAGLKRWGTSRLFKQSLFHFYDDYRGSYLLIREQLNNGDMQEALALLHKLRGTASNLAMNRLARASAELEEVLKNNKEADEQLTKLFTSLSHVLNSINILRQKEVIVDNQQQNDIGQLQNCDDLQDLYQQLQASVNQGLYDDKLIEAFIDALGQEAQSAEFSEVMSAISGFEFELANEKLASLMQRLCPV